jgi:hypothetical protein
MSLDQWTVVASGNASIATGINWAEGQAPSTINDSARQMMADLRAEIGYQSATVVAAGTTDLSTATGNYVPISGSATITGLGTMSAGITRKLVFTAAPLIVNNGTSNILPGGANIQAAAGDIAVVVSEGAGNWRWQSYTYAAGGVKGTFTATLTGCTATVTGTASYSIYDNAVTLDVPGLSGTSDTTACAITGLPAAIQPVSNKRFFALTQDNGASSSVSIALLSGGTLSLATGTTPTTFTNSGTKGLPSGGSFAYTLN